MTITRDEIDTFNKFGVGLRGDNIAFIIPTPREMTKHETLLFAAWIVTLADPLGEAFDTFLEAVQS